MGFQYIGLLTSVEVLELAIADFKYDLGKVEKGYNNRTSYVNLSSMQIASKTVSEEMKDLRTQFTGDEDGAKTACLHRKR